VRHEWLDLYVFETIEEVQQIATEWLWTYNNERPNMGIGGVTPAQKLSMAAQVLRSRPDKAGRITEAAQDDHRQDDVPILAAHTDVAKAVVRNGPDE
jgi:putative transposase